MFRAMTESKRHVLDLSRGRHKAADRAVIARRRLRRILRRADRAIATAGRARRVSELDGSSQQWAWKIVE